MQGTDLAKEGRAWRLLVDTPAGGAYNMAVDEAILLSHAREEVPPTLRLYQWNPPAVSAGFSQDILKKIDLEQCRELGIDVVRRPTGGRAVLHDKEITYSVTISLSLLPGSILETYRFISRGLVEAVNQLGLRAEVEDRPEKSRNPGSAACFDSPSWYEIEVSGRKLVGSAQTRQKGVLLQHGSVLLELDTARMQQVLSAPNEKVRQRIASALEERATAVNPELIRMGKEPVQPDAVEKALIEGFSRGLGITLTPSALTEKERILAEHLVKTKYSAPNWNFYRKEVGQHV